MSNWVGAIDTVASLKALSTSNIPDCTPIFVEGRNYWMAFRDGVACSVNNDVTCADANDAGGSWVKLNQGISTVSIYIPSPANQSYTIHPEFSTDFVVTKVEGYLESGALDLSVIYEDSPTTFSVDVGVGPGLLGLTQSYTVGTVYPTAFRLRADVSNVAAAVGLTITLDYVSVN